jgi:ribonucleoside-diphosphate reductase alpha chain
MSSSEIIKMPSVMSVIKRNGEKEVVSFDKISRRIKNLIESCEFKSKLNIDYVSLAQKVCTDIYDGVKTSELDELAAQVCASLTTQNPEYGVLASRIAISNHHKKTSPSFSEAIDNLYNTLDEDGNRIEVITKEVFNVVKKHKTKLNNIIDYTRDYDIDYFGFKTLERAYLLRVNGDIIERPQHMFLRVAIGIHGNDIKSVIECYDVLSQKKAIHATPTLFNAGTNGGQLASCFLLGINDDSIDGIYDALKETALISKNSGGIGIHVHDIRSKGANIATAKGASTGLVPMLRVFNDTARYVNQGGKRNGSFAIYLEPWHSDIFEFLELRKNQGSDELRARDLFYAMWIPDLFMKRVQENGMWSLMCPHRCPGLSDVYGKEFEDLYEKYEKDGKYRKQVPAQEIWFKILESQVETGTPYILFKDHVNRKSNQMNLGTIKSSNLCCVVPNTMILTKNGYFPIKDIEGEEVEVWNGKEWSKTTPFKTSDDQKIITIKFSNYLEINCTEYHKFYVETASRPADKSKPVIVEAKDLEKGMRIIRCDFELGNQSNLHMKYPYTSGIFAADGTYSKHNETQKRCLNNCVDGELFCKRHLNNNIQRYYDINNTCKSNSYEVRPLLRLYADKKKLIEHINYKRKTSSGKTIDLELPMDIEQKYTVPINYSLDTKLKWLAGLFDGDGCVVKCNGLKNLQLGSIHKNFLQDTIFMLQTIGINANLMSGNKEEGRMLPDGHGNLKKYDCKEMLRLNIDSSNLIKLIDLGFETKRLDIKNSRVPHHKTNKFITVTSIEDNNETSDTYCFDEPIEHKGVFNGILTGQCEITEFTSKDEIAVCNLASVALSSFVKAPDVPDIVKIKSIPNCVFCSLAKSWCERWNILTEVEELNEPIKGQKYPQISVGNFKGGYTDFIEAFPVNYDYEELIKVTKVITRNLNKIIDKTTYPVAKAKNSNNKHRPIGIGVQGLADVFMKMRIPFDSDRAKFLNEKIFETIYFAALTESNELAIKKAEKSKKTDLNFPGAYETFEGSPFSQGKFQFDLWEQEPLDIEPKYDWKNLKENVMTHGTTNSLLLAPMPTASTAQILGNNECFEPITSNIYVRRVLAGEFVLCNKYLQEELLGIGKWNNEVKNSIIANQGSVQHLKLPDCVKDVFKTIWEIKQRVVIDMAADRGKFIDQSQSMNLFMPDTSPDKVTSALFYGWKKGLKTGMYYLRTRPKSNAQQFTIDVAPEPVCESCSG